MQLIFRKVADVRREKELAERRKNEPKLDSNQDQLVRKIFSKFRCRDKSQLQTQYSVSEMEKGPDSRGGSVSNIAGAALSALGSNLAIKADGSDAVLAIPAADADGGLNNKVARPAATSTIAKSRWGRFSSGSTSDSVKSDSYLIRTAKDGVTGSKVFPKLQNITSSSLESATARGIYRQDTIEEGVECTTTLTKTSPSPVDDFDKSDAMAEPNLKKSETPSLTRRLSQFQLNVNDFKEMQSTVNEFKGETGRELSDINRRMERLEDMIRELVIRIDCRTPATTILVNVEQQTEFDWRPLPPSPPSEPPPPPPYHQSPSDRDSTSTTTDGHQIPPLTNIIMRKRRSKTRIKGIAPSIPYRAIPQRSRSLLCREAESDRSTARALSRSPTVAVAAAAHASTVHAETAATTSTTAELTCVAAATTAAAATSSETTTTAIPSEVTVTAAASVETEKKDHSREYL